VERVAKCIAWPVKLNVKKNPCLSQKKRKKSIGRGGGKSLRAQKNNGEEGKY